MQTAFTIHMADGPSIRRIVSTESTGDTIQATINTCDENFSPLPGPRVFSSTAVRVPWRRRWLRNLPRDAEAVYHHNLRAHYKESYGWRYELNAVLSDPL